MSPDGPAQERNPWSASLTIAPGTHRTRLRRGLHRHGAHADGSGHPVRCLRPEPSQSLFTFDRYRFGTDTYGNLNLTFVGARFPGQDVATNVVTDHVTRVEPATP